MEKTEEKQKNRKNLTLYSEPIPEENSKLNIFGTLTFSRSGTSIKIFGNGELFGLSFVSEVLDLLVGTRKFVNISFFVPHNFENSLPHCYKLVGRFYLVKNLFHFFNIRGELFAECLKKDLQDLLEGVNRKILLFNPNCAKKYLDFEFGFPGVVPV